VRVTDLRPRLGRQDPSHNKMYSRSYKRSSPLLRCCGSPFLLLPYRAYVAHSFWIVRHDGFYFFFFSGRQLEFANSAHCLPIPCNLQVFLLRTARIAVPYPPVHCSSAIRSRTTLPFHTRGPRARSPISTCDRPLWVSYLGRGYAWKTLLGKRRRAQRPCFNRTSTHEPVSSFFYSPCAVVLMLTRIYIYNAFRLLFFTSTLRSRIFPAPHEASQDLVPTGAPHSCAHAFPFRFLPGLDALAPHIRIVLSSAILRSPARRTEALPPPCSPTSCKAFSALRTTGRWAPLISVGSC